MGPNDIHLHLVRISVDETAQPESYDIDCIHFIVKFAIDFIQKAVDNFISCHQHLSSIKHLHPCHLSYPDSVHVHRGALDFEKWLVEIKEQAGHHVCFLRVDTEVAIPTFFERNVVVLHLPGLSGLHHKEVLSSGSRKDLISLGLAVGAALHEIAHLFGAFHSVSGIMSRQPNAVGLLENTTGDMRMESYECFFDNYSICIFAHGPFFNRVMTSLQRYPVLFKISEKEVHLKCSNGILLVVIIQGTKYHDVKILDALPSVILRIDERRWDLIQVYSGSYDVNNITK